MSVQQVVGAPMRVGGRATWSHRMSGRLRRSVLAWPLAALAALVVLVINEISHQRSIDALERLEQRATATVHLDALLRRLLDAETGQRGYLLTGRRIYLEPYQQASRDATTRIDWLEQHYAADVAHQARLADLRRHAIARLGELAAGVQAFEADQRDVLRAVIANAARDRHIDAVRRLAGGLASDEQARVADERQTVAQTLRFSRIGVNVTAALGFIALLLLVRQTAALERLERGHADAMRREHARLESEVERRTADLSELARHLQTVREDECERLARDLNDELGALLAQTRAEVVRLRSDPAASAPDVRDRLDHLAETIDSGISLKRRIIEDLRPSSLAEVGLVGAIERLAREFAERSGIPVTTDLRPVTLSDGGDITAYRIVQEALTNIAKYAGNCRVRVELTAAGAHARLVVDDDGCGFDLSQPRSTGHGLMGMRYRVEATGGTLGVASSPGGGTRIDAQLPLRGVAPR